MPTHHSAQQQQIANLATIMRDYTDQQIRAIGAETLQRHALTPVQEASVAAPRLAV